MYIIIYIFTYSFIFIFDIDNTKLYNIDNSKIIILSEPLYLNITIIITEYKKKIFFKFNIIFSKIKNNLYIFNKPRT